MKRTLATLAVPLVLVVLAPAAVAKGPHASLHFGGSGAVEAGEPLDVTLELLELEAPGPPTLVATRGHRRVAARGRREWSDEFAARYTVELMLPAEGRWRLAVTDGKRRFAFPAVAVGGGIAPRDYVAFPDGSLAKREGGGGPYDVPDTAGGRGTPLPPEVVSIASPEEPGGGDGVPVWMLLPAAGPVLAGAGVWRRRGR